VYAVELYPELGYYRKVIGVDLKTAVDPTLANTLPTGYLANRTTSNKIR